MPTLADLQTRIATDTNRSDLAGVLASRRDQAISEAIDEYANTRFFFNESRVVSSIPANVQFFNLPSGLEHIDQMFAVVGSVNFLLRRVTPEEMEILYMVPSIGQPTDFTVMQNGGQLQIRVWPTPNKVYPAIFLSISDATPALDFTNPAGSSNAWTNDGFRLIAATAEESLYRNVFRDPDGAAMAAQERQRAFSNLMSQNVSQLATGRIRSSW